MFDWVSNESPELIDLLGDETPELVCTRDGFFGFSTIDPKDPLATWEFHVISPQVTAKRFGHGLGIGDVNGDDRLDIIHPKGWYEQPESNALTSRWRHHEVTLCGGSGGAEMYAYDVDGDGDNGIITSDSAHNFGLSWFEQFRVVGGQARPQDMSNFSAVSWSGKSQLWWTGARPGDTLTLELPPDTGMVDLDVVLTCARDYGFVQLSLDGKPLGDPIDLYETDVVTTGILSFPKLSLKGQPHNVQLKITVANSKAVKAYMFAIDYLRIQTADGKFVSGPKPTVAAVGDQTSASGIQPNPSTVAC